jgi:hypothetical protein
VIAASRPAAPRDRPSEPCGQMNGSAASGGCMVNSGGSCGEPMGRHTLISPPVQGRGSRGGSEKAGLDAPPFPCRASRRAVTGPLARKPGDPMAAVGRKQTGSFRIETAKSGHRVLRDCYDRDRPIADICGSPTVGRCSTFSASSLPLRWLRLRRLPTLSRKNHMW